MKGVIGWFARNGVAANLLLVVIVVAGAITLTDLKQEVFPEFSLDIITVTTQYRGASPEDVEEGVCVRIEEALQGVDGIKEMTATATEGSASIVLEVLAGYDVRAVLEDAKTSIDAIDTFPEEVEKPTIREVSSRNRVIEVVISGNADLGTLKRLGQRVRDELTALPEISQADLLNVPPYEISIEVSEEAMRRWGLTFDRVANAVRAFSVDLPGGSVKTETGEVLFRTKGQAYSGEEFEGLVLLTRPDGTRIHVRDVANVIDGFEEQTVAANFDGKPSVTVKVFRVGDQNAVTIAEVVHEYVRQAASWMPEGIEIATWQDDARLLKGRIDLLVKNAYTGLILVFVVLALFMRVRLAFWVTIGIPISFLGSIALMPVFDLSVNMLSLFSFILVLGIVVDDAIVVGENIYATQQRTGKGMSGAIRGCHEVLVPVAFGVLTTMAAFTPMLFVPGIMGKVIWILPMIILPTLFFSLIESNLILPRHLSHFRAARAGEPAGPVARAWNGFFDLFSDGLDWFIRKAYRPVLRAALEWRYLTLSVALFTVLLTAGMVGAGIVRFILFPDVGSDAVVGYLTMPRDASAESTRAGLDRLERAVEELRRDFAREGQDPVAHVMTSMGQHPFRAVQGGPMGTISAATGDYLGEVNLGLVPAEDRGVPAARIANAWREKVGEIPGAVELSIQYDLIGGSKPIDLRLSGPDLAGVREVAGLVKARLAEYPGVKDVSDTYRAGKPELKLALTPEGQALGLTLQNLGRQVRQGFFGEEAQRIQRDRDEVRVMVRYPQGSRTSIGDLEQMRVRTPGGSEVPFSTVATGSVGRGPASITRIDRQRSINVQADLDDTVTTLTEVVGALDAEFLPDLMARHPGIQYSFEGDQADFSESTAGLLEGFGLIMFVMYGLLAIPLKSYWKPLLILSAVPFGMIGAIWSHVAFGLSVSFMSMCGMVAVAGVVVNDGLVLVTFINRRSRKRHAIHEAVREAGEARFRPILLTSLTTAAGVTPLMLEKSLQAQFLIPMAVALAFGVLFATLVTLLLVPSLYLILDDVRSALRWLSGSSRRQELEAARAAPSPGAAAGD